MARPMRCRFDQRIFDDIEQFGEHLSTQRIEPLQLSSGRLRLGFKSLRFEDAVVMRLECNRVVSDRLHMDPAWLLLVVLLAPQRWGAKFAPAESLVVIAPGAEYRNRVSEGFRCVEAAVRLDLADKLGLAHLRHLKGKDAVIPMSPAAARRLEHRIDRLLDASAATGAIAIDGVLAQILRQGCLEILCSLRCVACSSTRCPPGSEISTPAHRWLVAEKAVQTIEAAPIDRPPSVETLATTLGTTRRTLLNAFQEAFGTSPSRYILAKRLNGARRSMNLGESHSVTDAALEYGFENFGRFACYYRRLFGEAPSSTLFRAGKFGREVRN